MVKETIHALPTTGMLRSDCESGYPGILQPRVKQLSTTSDDLSVFFSAPRRDRTFRREEIKKQSGPRLENVAPVVC